MTEAKKESLNPEELQQVSAGVFKLVDGEQQANIFMNDGTAHDSIGAKVDITIL